MSIELVIRLPDGSVRQTAVDADPDAVAGELARQLAVWAGLQDRVDLFIPRTNEVVAGRAPLRSLKLMRGDVIQLIDPGRQPSPAGSDLSSDLALVAVGGPAMGQQWPLAEGEYVIGRGSDSEVRVHDGAMSRTHLRLRVENGLVHASDAGSTNGTFIDGVRLTEPRQLQAGDIVEAGATLLAVRHGSKPAARRVTPDLEGRVGFNRPPRITPPPQRATFTLNAPPARGDANRLPLASALVPLVLALILWRLMPDNPSFLVILALSPMMAIVSFVGDRRQGKRRATREEAAWRKNLDDLANRLSEDRAAASERLRQAAPDLGELHKRAVGVTSELWQRRPIDHDFLLLRCGWGDRPWSPELQREPGGAAELRREADEMLEPLMVLPSVPLTVDLPRAGVVGFCGDRERASGLLRWSILQLATMHSPEEVTLTVVAGSDLTKEMSWLGWLPHLEPGGDGRLGADAVAAVDALVERRRGHPGPHSATVVIVDDSARVTRGALTRSLREGPGVGVYVLWLGAARDDLPGECGAIVEVAGSDLAITLTEDGSTFRGAAETVPHEPCTEIVRALAPLRDIAPRAQRAEIPRVLTLFDLYPPAERDLSALRTRWASAAPGLRAAVGRAHDGPFILDLLDDGPHALVGGTTGAGKSQLLQSMIAAFALAYPPTRLTFLLIDYKGGAAFKDFVQLPHTVGSVTDLDLRLSERALVSLDAEIKRRERVLRGANARDIAEMESGIDAAPPRLLLVVDEFATLVKELPSFVDGVVDIAQRGRSLGIHLVLATQRPAGVINDAVRANTNLRIALRVADEHDSNDVIGVSDAARIPRSIPGRAYVRRGHTEVEEIQTAYSGAPIPADAGGVRVRDRNASNGSGSDAHGPTQIEKVVELAREAALAERLPAPSCPWLPPLPERLELADLSEPVPEEPREVAFGLVDRPDLQAQEKATFHLDKDAHLLVLGAGGSGKSTLLRSLAAAFASSWSPDMLHIYGLDFGSGALRPLQTLPHCGDVVPGEDLDRVGRLFSMLAAEVAQRRTLFASRGVADLTTLDAGPDAEPRPPRILVLLDGYAGFASAFERVDFGRLVDTLPRLVSDGRSVGLHFIISTDRRGAIPSAVAALIPTRVILRLAEADDYLALGLDARSLKDVALPPGRGFIDGREVQIALAGKTPAAREESASLREIAAKWSGAERVAPPRPVNLLPTSLERSSLPTPAAPFSCTIGIAESTHEPVEIDLEHGHVVIAGPYRSGRSTALGTIALSLRSTTPDATMHLVAPRRSPLMDLDLWDRRIAGSEAASVYAEGLAGELEAASPPLLVFVDDADELTEGPVAYALEPLVRRGRDKALRFVAAAEAHALLRSFGGWLSEMRKDKQGILLDPDLDVDGDLLGVRLPRTNKTSWPPGRGYLVARGAMEIIQVAR